MKPCIIKTEEQYEQALDRIGTLMEGDPAADSDDGMELNLLATLIEQYEDIVYPVDLPSPVAAIKFRMKQAGLKQKDHLPNRGSQYLKPAKPTYKNFPTSLRDLAE
ncbi:helix-turn-helix domain-containing protein [Rubritalea tangerina]|uniref:Type II toxin-antitoxin system HigA family antitoxin n=1 Tax=Rubritalea tangerina TaxID=430798 RepID=A0ABW4ZDT4_9BACT